jgi:hypothetical protein
VSLRAVACALLCAAAWLAPCPASASAAAPAQSTPAAERAREQARDVLSQRRFRPTGVPRPLRSVRERVGAAIRSLGRPFEEAFRWIVGWMPGGSPVAWGLLAVLALLAGVFGARRIAARRGEAAAGAAVEDGRPPRESAGRLRHEADRAERRGDLDAALRLRFRAGLVELDHRELIELRPALTNHELLRALPSPTLAGLVDGFEAVAYGGRPADEDDLRSARDGWPRVPEEAARR